MVSRLDYLKEKISYLKNALKSSPTGAPIKPAPSPSPTPAPASSNNHSGLIVRLLIVIGVIVGIYAFLTLTTLGQSFAESTVSAIDSLNIGDSISSSVSYVNCISTRFLDQQTITSGGAFKVCGELATEKTAKSLGCTECYDFTAQVERQNVRAQPGTTVDTFVTMSISAPSVEYQQSIGGRTVTSTIREGTNLMIDSDPNPSSYSGRYSWCAVDNSDPLAVGEGQPCSLDPDLFGPGKKSDLRVFFPVPACEDEPPSSIKPAIKMSYVYVAEGISPITLAARDAQVSNIETPITTPGPIKFDVIPVSTPFVMGLDVRGEVTFKFRNQGAGSAVIDKITIRQQAPPGLGKLKFIDCRGAINRDVSGEEEFTIEGISIYVDSRNRGDVLSCRFSLPASGGSDASTIEELGFANYVITGQAEYSYTLEKKIETIFIDKSVCEQETAS